MFDDLLELITNSKKENLYIRGEEKNVKGAACFRSVNIPNDSYIKVSFNDGSGLILIIGEKLVYYSPLHLGKLDSINDDQVGVVKNIDYEGESFCLVNQNDYQFVTQLIRGNLHDIEGECRFSDYMTKDGDKMLSLGWNSYNGKRDDAYAELLSETEIEIK